MHIAVYDHSYSKIPEYEGPLQRLSAKLAGLPPHPERRSEDLVAVEDLLKSDARVFFVHLDRPAWVKLVHGLKRIQFAVRFSTEPLAPTPHTILSLGGMHVRKRLQDITATEFETLVSLFSDNAAEMDRLRDGIVPKKLRSLIVHREPHHLWALYILLTGTLAFWATDDTDVERAQRSREALDTSSEIPTAPVPMDSIEMWRRCLNLPAEPEAQIVVSPFVIEIAQELGMDPRELTSDREAEALWKLVIAVLSGAAANRVAEDICRPAYTWLQQKLSVRG